MYSFLLGDGFGSFHGFTAVSDNKNKAVCVFLLTQTAFASSFNLISITWLHL